MDILSAMRAFHTVADNGGFARPGATSSVTRQLDALEDHLGARLLHRPTRGVTLTPAGERYRDHVREILEDVAAAACNVTDEAGLLRGSLRVGVLRTSVHSLAVRLTDWPARSPFVPTPPTAWQHGELSTKAKGRGAAKA